jgi:hypothetical protein
LKKTTNKSNDNLIDIDSDYRTALISKIDEINKPFNFTNVPNIDIQKSIIEFSRQSKNDKSDGWRLLLYRYDLRDNLDFIKAIIAINYNALQYATPRVQLELKGVVCKHN